MFQIKNLKNQLILLTFFQKFVSFKITKGGKIGGKKENGNIGI
jgi:hypothetical protein